MGKSFKKVDSLKKNYFDNRSDTHSYDENHHDNYNYNHPANGSGRWKSFDMPAIGENYLNDIDDDEQPGSWNSFDMPAIRESINDNYQIDSNFVPSYSIDQNNMSSYSHNTNLDKQGQVTILNNRKKKKNVQKPFYQSDKKDNDNDLNSLVTKVDQYPGKIKKGSSLATYQLAEIIFKNEHTFFLENTLYHWNKSKSYYLPVTSNYAELFIRKNTPEEFKYKINSNIIREMIQWVKSNHAVVISKKDLPKLYRYIPFKNGIYDTKKEKLKKHDSNFFFTSIINANFDANFDTDDGKVFEFFMKSITQGDTALYNLIQEVFGYIISEVRNIKNIIYLLGPKDTGKSVILRLLEFLVGSDATSSLSFEQLCYDNYLVKIIGKRLNVSGETSEISLKRLDYLKKLTGGDAISCRPIYEQPLTFINSAALVFAGNNLPKIKVEDSYNAFTNRLLIIPFNHSVSHENIDIHLFEKLCKEIDYIANWSIHGFHRWKNNNFEFTKPEAIERQKEEIKLKSNSIKSFLKNECIFNPTLQIHSNSLLEAYNMYCLSLNVIPKTQYEFHAELKKRDDIQYKRFRIDKQNKNGYIGIQLKSNLEENISYDTCQ